MPVSESEKLGVSLVGCHFSEKDEHIPIKKRRFLYRVSSPPCNTPNISLEGEERHATCPKDSSLALQLNPNATCLTKAVAEICQRGGNDDKLDEKEFMKTNKEIGEVDYFSGISILAGAACSSSLGAETAGCEGPGIVSSMMKNPIPLDTVELKENNDKSVNICNKKSDSHTSITPPKCVASSTDDHSSRDAFILDSSSQVPVESEFSNTNPEQKSSARDVRLNWDLNTVMEAWDEPFVSEHEVSASDAAAHNNVTFGEERKNDCTKDNTRYCKLGSDRESGSLSKNVSNLDLSVELKSWAPGNEDFKPGDQKSDGYAEICEPSCREFDSVQHAGVEETASLHEFHIDNVNNSIPPTRALTLEKPTCGTSENWMNLAGKSFSGLGRTEAVNTQLSMECSIPPGFDRCLNSPASKENAGVSSTIVCPGNSANLPSTTTQTSRCESDKHDLSLSTVAISSIHDAESPSQIGFGYDNSQSDNRAGSGIDKLDEISVGYDSQYEDGELRESTIHAWKGHEGNEGENGYVIDNRGDDMNLGTMDIHESSSHCRQEGSSGMKQPNVGSGIEANLISNVLLPEKLHSSEVSGSGLNEMIDGQRNSKRQDTMQHASQSDEWKMNVSGWDTFPENHRISSNNFSINRNLSSRKFSYREPKDGFETKEVEMKAEGSRFNRKESLTRIGGSSTRDVFRSRDRVRMQGCSSKAADGLTSRPERESGALRSFGRGRYSPRSHGSARGGGMWNHSPERGRDLKRLPSPSYHGPSFLRSMQEVGSADHMPNEAGMDLSDAGRRNTVSYLTRCSFRSRSPTDREAIEFHAHLGLRSTGDTSHDRIANMGRGRGRGRSVRYGTRLDGEGPRGRYHGPASDECDEFMTEYSHSFPRRRGCFSPIERRGNNSYAHHQSDSRSPPRTRSPIGGSGFRRRSRSPNFRPDTRMQRLRSPNYRRGFEADHAGEYNSGPRNNNSSPPPSSRWVNYKERAAVFDRRSPPGRPDGPQGERFSFYDSSRKPKQNEHYRSENPGRFSDQNETERGRPRYIGTEGDRPSNGYRRGGFIRRYDMDEPAKRLQYEDEDSVGRGFVKIVWTHS